VQLAGFHFLDMERSKGLAVEESPGLGYWHGDAELLLFWPRAAQDLHRVEINQLSTATDRILAFQMTKSVKKASAADSMADLAHQRLEEMVVALQLPPGSHRSEENLSEKIRVGRTPGEAVKRLQADHLISILPTPPAPPSSAGWKTSTIVPSKFLVSARNFAAHRRSGSWCRLFAMTAVLLIFGDVAMAQVRTGYPEERGFKSTDFPE
jgi:hypothetical protein